MFQDMSSSGKHLICDFKKITNNKLLNDKLALKLLCKNLCMENNYTILGEVDHEFHPYGCSFILLLSESHLSLHTFPERNHISFDLYTCRQYDDNSIYIEIYTNLCNKLEASLIESDFKIIDRYF